MKTKRIKQKNKDVFFSKPRVVKKELIKKDNEFEFTLKSKVEIPVYVCHKFSATISKKDQKAMKECIEYMHIQAIEKGINKMLETIKL